MTSLTELTTNCRACLKESLEPYFEMSKECYFSSKQNFGEVFNFCTHLKVQINDHLPQRICLFCVQELQKSYVFLQKVLESNKKLLDLKECYIGRGSVKDNDGSAKDPLESDTENEDTLENGIKKKQSDAGEFVLASFDNADNAVEDYQLNDTLISPFLSDNEDPNKNDFFTSVESLIFPQGRLKCKICHKSYFTSVGLKAHMNLHLPKTKSISKSSSTADKYLKGIRKAKPDISDDENSYGHSLKTKDESKIKQTKPKKIYPCEVCGKEMISASKLRYHMVMHTGEKDFLCTMCPKAYSTIYALKHHMHVHTGERPYECKFCGDRFLRPTTLKSHMRRHTGERPYGCDICGKRFIQHSSMATHMQLNHMDKTIQCPYCDKKYARQTDLNTHLLSHNGYKPFACQICRSRFTRQSNLTKHMNQQHSNFSFGDKQLKNKTYDAVCAENIQSINCQNQDLRADGSFENPSCSWALN